MIVEVVDSAWRRVEIRAVSIAFSDLPIPTVDEHFTALIDGDLAGRLNRLCLRGMMGGDALVSGASDCPPVFCGDYMLIFMHTHCFGFATL